LNIKINIVDKHPTVIGAPVIVCGNSDYTIEFAFDADWDAAAVKTARFVFHHDGAVKYQDVVFAGSSVAVPVLSDIREVAVGVYAGDLHTTTPARIPCDRSILCGTGVEYDEPDPDIYNQILEVVNQLAGPGADHPARTDNPHGVTAEQVGARPADWMPTAAEVGARPADWMPTAEQVGARPADWMPTASDVKARPDTWTPTAEQVGARPADWMPTASDVKARPDTWMPTVDQVGAAPASHATDTNNPHGVTAEQVGAAPASHATDKNNPHDVTAEQVGATPASHATDKNNPHDVTAEQVGAAPEAAVAEVSTAVGGVVLRKINNIVYVSVPTGYAIIGAVTIPEGYRPSRDLAMLCIYHNPSYVMCEAVLTIGANGSVTVKYGSGNIASDGWFCVTTSYHIKQS